jgi:hypothetical protein
MRKEYEPPSPSGREGTTEQLRQRFAVLSEMNSDPEQLAKDKSGAAQARSNELFQISLELKAREAREKGR